MIKTSRAATLFLFFTCFIHAYKRPLEDDGSSIFETDVVSEFWQTQCETLIAKIIDFIRCSNQSAKNKESSAFSIDDGAFFKEQSLSQWYEELCSMQAIFSEKKTAQNMHIFLKSLFRLLFESVKKRNLSSKERVTLYASVLTPFVQEEDEKFKSLLLEANKDDNEDTFIDYLSELFCGWVSAQDRTGSLNDFPDRPCVDETFYQHQEISFRSNVALQPQNEDQLKFLIMSFSANEIDEDTFFIMAKALGITDFDFIANQISIAYEIKKGIKTSQELNLREDGTYEGERSESYHHEKPSEEELYKTRLKAWGKLKEAILYYADQTKDTHKKNEFSLYSRRLLLQLFFKEKGLNGAAFEELARAVATIYSPPRKGIDELFKTFYIAVHPDDVTASLYSEWLKEHGIDFNDYQMYILLGFIQEAKRGETEIEFRRKCLEYYDSLSSHYRMFIGRDEFADTCIFLFKEHTKDDSPQLFEQLYKKHLSPFFSRTDNNSASLSWEARIAKEVKSYARGAIAENVLGEVIGALVLEVSREKRNDFRILFVKTCEDAKELSTIGSASDEVLNELIKPLFEFCVA